MRVSTNTVYEQGVSNMLRNQAQMLRTQEQISTSRRIVTPADDPVAAARVLELSQSRAVTEQFDRNGQFAQGAIGQQEQALQRYTRLLQDVKTMAVGAGNAALGASDRTSLASELRGRYEELLSIANTTDANGLYLFSGYQGTTQPFAETAAGVVAYSGDDGSRLIQIGPSRDIPVSHPGSDVFVRIPTGNGTFATAAAAANTGSGLVSPGTVRDASAWNSAGNPGNFDIRFHVNSTVSPATTTYDIVDTVNNVSLLTGAAPASGPHLRTYTTGTTISLARQSPPDTNPVAFDYGIALSVSGSPATGDVFTVAPSTSQDVFATVYGLITALESAGTGTTLNTRFTNLRNTALSNLDNALTVNLTAVSAIGARAGEIDTARETAGDASLQFDKTLSSLQDLDYASALSQLTQQKVSLEAAQKSFIQVQQLSLFQYL